jgi:hypothetical protein
VYRANEFCADLSTLPIHRALVVLMGQCHSGGFNRPLIRASRARQTSIAAAAPLGKCSNVTGDGCWDAFAANWIAAQLGHDTHGCPVDADTNCDGSIGTCEAFAYAVRVNATYADGLRDDPVQTASSASAWHLTLESCRPRIGMAHLLSTEMS